MAVSIITKLSSAFTDTTLPKLYRDPILTAGSMFLFDLANPFCWNPANTVADGAVVNNLLDGAPGANLRIPSGTMTYVAGKGFQLSATATFQRIEIDSGTNYFQTNLTDDYLIQAWVKYPATDPGAGNVGLIFNKGGSVIYSYGQPGPFLASRYPAESINTAYGDITGKFDANTATNTNYNNAAVGTVPGSHLFGLAKVGTNLQIYKDGALIGSSALLTPALTANSNTMNFGGSTIQSAVQGTILNRISAEDLTVSASALGISTAAQCAAQIATEYAANSARFV